MVVFVLSTGSVLWANLGLLFFLSLFPFTTAWMDDSEFARTLVVIYGVNLLAAAIAYFVLQGVIIRNEGAGSPLRQAVGRDLKGKTSVILYLAGIVSALLTGHGHVGVGIALGFFVAVAILWLIPDRRIDHIIRAQGLPD